ncbi:MULTISPECIES: cytochrome c oxidase assembly protein [unclassified Luteococcus]|uniref:cytochrome c oxidase assembly protein n=1 Tax=unclassified Luteococcus TaxID=2639923 RepID=UPI00313EC163
MLLTTQFAVDLLVWLASAVTMGAWTTAAFIRPADGKYRLRLDGSRLLPLARLSAIAGAAACLLMANLTNVRGYGHGESLAWCLAAGLGLASVVFTAIKAWESALYALALQAIALVAPIAATENLVARNHDVAGDARMIAAVAFTVLAGTWACRLFLTADDAGSKLVCARMRFLSVVAAAVVVVSDLATVWAQGGQLDTDARWHLARAGAAVMIAGLAFTSSAAGALAATVVGLLGQFAAANAFRTQPSTAGEALPTDVQRLGYSVAEWPTLVNLVTNWRINLFFLGLSVVAVTVYLYLVAQLKKRGDHWPAGRTAAWLIGWATVVFVTSSGIGRYAPAVFSVHMLLNLSLNMLCAMILVLGGFITLLLRATPARRRTEPAGLREWLTASMHSRYLAFMYNPIIALVFMTGTYYVFYLSGLFTASLHLHWLHQFFYLHFLVSGYIFYGLIIGVDQPPHPLPHIGKLGLIIGAMPFHAFFGVILMAKTTLYGEAFLKSLGHAWMEARGLQHDQWVGGTIAWAGGEFPLVIALIALLTQWQRQDRKESTRFDRHVDAGTDDSYDAYNQMLAQLAERDRQG